MTIEIGEQNIWFKNKIFSEKNKFLKINELGSGGSEGTEGFTFNRQALQNNEFLFLRSIYMLLEQFKKHEMDLVEMASHSCL